jgi:hypothetical protein
MPRRTDALLLICGALSAMALIAHDLHARRHGQASYEAAQAIAGGYEPGERALDEIAHKPLQSLSQDPAAEADQLRAHELDAGAIWAKAHHAARAADCPADSQVFYAGCVAVMRGEWPADPE